MAIRRTTESFLKRTSTCINNHRTRAKEAGEHLDYGLDELRHLISESLVLPCRYCGAALTDQNWSCDHSHPISRGGSFSRHNLEVICLHCNQAKGALTPEEFADLWYTMRDWQSCARLNVIHRLKSGSIPQPRRHK